MKVPMNILRISAGTMSDPKNGERIIYASAIILDDNIANQNDHDRIDIGQQHAKVKISTDNENALSKRLAESGLIPALIMCEAKTSVKGGAITMEIVDFYPPNKNA